MKVLYYKEGAKRVAWLRELQSAARRDDALIAATRRLRCFPPNTGINIKHPWKPRERFSIRAWCPLHDGRWARLIVRADERGLLSYECSQGCAPGEVERLLSISTRDPQVTSDDGIAPLPNGKSDDAAGVIHDAAHLFSTNIRKFGGRHDGSSDPAA